MNKYLMWKQLITYFALTAIVISSCPTNQNILNLVAGSVSFSIDKNSSMSTQSYVYSFAQSFTSVPSIALALQDFSLNYLHPHAFSVVPTNPTLASVFFQFDYTNAIWSKVRINFWATTLRQIQIGTFKIDNLQINGTCNCATAYTAISKPFDANTNPVLRIFINGYDVSSNDLQISVSPTNLQNTQITIKITLGATTSVKKAWFSYLVFAPSACNFGSYGGSISQANFKQTYSVDISKTLYNANYMLYGLNQLTLTTAFPIAFTSSIDQDFVATVTASRNVDSFTLIYIAVSPLPSSLCSNCGQGLVASNSNCLTTCPQNTYAFTYKDGAIGCRSCSSKLGLIFSGGKCVTRTVTAATSTSEMLLPTWPTVTSSPSLSISSSNVKTISSAFSQVVPSVSGPILGSSSVQTLPVQTAPVQTASVQAVPFQTGSIQTVPFETVPIQAAPVQTVSIQTAPIQTGPSQIMINAPILINQPSDMSVSVISGVNCPSNAFFNGNQCVCRVGFIFVNTTCKNASIGAKVPIIITNININNKCNATTSIVTPQPQPIIPQPQPQPQPPVNLIVNPCQNQYEVWNSNVCVCQPGYSRNSYGVCATSSPIVNPLTPLNCGPNSFDNGLGFCVCQQGYYQLAGSCIQGTPCPANSTRQANGNCSCNPGLTNYNGFCSMCPAGALWSASTSKCIFVCGQNAVYSTATSSCQCNPGFGLFNSICQVCPNNYFINNGYCATCPIYSVYNSTTKSCSCQTGYFINQFGVCVLKCGNNENYNPSTLKCQCLQGFARISGVCGICPSGSSPNADGNACSSCGSNQILVNGRCLCVPGFAFNSQQHCVTCSSIPGAFIVNGICSVCPNNFVYDGVSTCVCPPGKVPKGSSCTSQCQSDELMDSEGNCYTCGINQMISGGKCVCLAGYTLSSCGICTLSCSTNQFVFQGGCATCPLNTVYNAAINGCTCPQGYYMSNYKVCQKFVLTPVNCSTGQYFDSTNGCSPCNSQCRTCQSSNQCLTCATNGYTPNAQGQCVIRCGDGLIVGQEQCDDGNTYSSDGCSSSCQIEIGYTCIGQPSACRNQNIPIPPVQPPIIMPPIMPPSTSDSSLRQSGKTSINSNNVFITLVTNPTFTFPNPTAMQTFIQASFPSGTAPTVYCAQRNSPALNTFDCLLIYPSGVPNNKFAVNFSYNYQSKTGYTSVVVDPLASVSNNRPRKF